MLKKLQRVLISVKLNLFSVKKIRKIMCSATIVRDEINDSVLRQLFLEAVKAVQPHVLIKNQITYHQRHLKIKGESFVINKPCYIAGFGKAVLGMAIEIEKILGPDLQRALVSVPAGIFENLKVYKRESSKIEFVEGANNNLPDEDAVTGANKIKKLAESLTADDFLIVLISGGGSALLPLPIPPINLAEKQSLIKKLSQSGADIIDLNIVRKHLSQLKGGKLAQLAYPARVVTLILSDVVGDPLDIIASGPTIEDRSTSEDAIKILKKYSVYEETPESIKTVLENAKENGKLDKYQGKSSLPSSLVRNFVIGNNKMTTLAARNLSEALGYQCVVVSHQVEGDVNDVARIYAEFAKLIHDITKSKGKEIGRFKEFIKNNFQWKCETDALENMLKLDFLKDMIFIFAGEPTVIVKGKGKGGRNQQLALSFSLQLNNLEITSCDISFLSAGTDGIDGPTDAAGALGCQKIIQEAEKEGLQAGEYLENNDAYGFYSRLSDGKFLIKIGHTGTNVMDLHFLKITPFK